MANHLRAARILVLTTTLPTEEGDSTPSFVLDLAQAMAEQMPAEITIVAPAAPGAPLRQRFGPIEVRRFRYLPKRWASLGAATAVMPAIRQRPIRLLQVPFLLTGLLLSAVRETRRVQPDVVHAHWVVPVGLAAVMARRLAARPQPQLVVTSHGSDVNALRGPLWDRVRGYVVSRADLTLPVSPDIAERLGVCHTRAIPMGAAPMFAAVAHRADEDAPFLFVGRLADNKGVDVLLKALASVPCAQLRIIGDGPERPALEDLARALGVWGRCEFLGTLDKRSVASEMGGARAFILASRTGADGSEEGSPTVLMEAVLAGVPVIASRIGGVPALFDHELTALLFDQGDICGLAAHMERAERCPEHVEKLALEASLRLGSSATFSETARRYIDAIAALP